MIRVLLDAVLTFTVAVAAVIAWTAAIALGVKMAQWLGWI